MTLGRGDLSFDSGRGRPSRAGLPAAMPGETRETAITISELNDATRQIIESSFPHFWVRGEVNDFKRHRSGHWYFSLRDATAQMSCVVWSSDQRGIPAPPDDGMQVVALAQMTMYAVRGTLQLRITRLDADGDGLQRKAMELTIARLKAEGLLAPERKRALPRFPRCIGVVTSTSGAAIRDIIAVVERRRPGMRIVVAPTAVQGDGAPVQICRAIARMARLRYVDIIIVGRGGGSREDLWAFNDERVARAVATCRVPVISAVGHEIDITICDLAADVRAPTPSAAAESAIPSLLDLQAMLEQRRRRIITVVQRHGASAAMDLRTVARDMRAASIRAVERRSAVLAATAGRLNALSPLSTLQRGYSVARDSRGGTLASASQFMPGDTFRLQLRDGSVHATVDEVKVGEPARLVP